MTPIEVLEEELHKYERNITVSADALKVGLITPELHETHKTNNEPKIKEFKRAIAILKTAEL
jgi:hypothetical protein